MPILVIILTVGMIAVGSSTKSLVYAGSENSATGKGEICENNELPQGKCQQTLDSPGQDKKGTQYCFIDASPNGNTKYCYDDEDTCEQYFMQVIGQDGYEDIGCTKNKS